MQGVLNKAQGAVIFRASVGYVSVFGAGAEVIEGGVTPAASMTFCKAAIVSCEGLKFPGRWPVLQTGAGRTRQVSDGISRSRRQ